MQESLISQNVPSENLLQVSELENSFDKWWYFPILQDVHQLLETTGAKWALFLEPNCEPAVFEIMKLLTAYSPAQPFFLGENVLDESPAIIHHYNMDKNFFYPDRHKGFILSKTAIINLIDLLTEVPAKWSFHIDAIHELTKFMKDKLDLHLTNVEMKTKLRAFPIEQHASVAYDEITLDDVAVAVKTAEIFHENRILVTKDLWGSAFPNLAYYSDAQDETIPTIPTNIPNAERGHCKKTKFIMEDIIKRFPDKKWYLIADDDTIMNPERLLARLKIYDSKKSMHVGEKYGFALDPLHDIRGYTYITGGGGMLWTELGMRQMVDCRFCICSLTDPDDMRIGMWAKRLKIPLVHDPSFHQAQPEHYHPTRLQGEPQATSFHKHSGKFSPEQVAQEYLSMSKATKDEL